MLVFLVLASIGIAYCSPHGQYLILNNEAQQSYPQYVDRQSVVLLNNPSQSQEYAAPNNLIHLQNNPEQLSYINPSSFYAWVQKEGLQTPQSIQPTQTIEPTTAPKEDKPDSVEPESLPSNTAATKPDSEAADTPTETENQKLENFEPDAELIPETVNTQTVKPEQPRTPVIPFPGNQGIIPGQRVYIINGPPQFYSNDPLIGYPQLNTHLRPQPALRYPVFPQRFLILGQPSGIQHPTYQQQGQPIVYLRNQLDQSRVPHAQMLQVPPLVSFQRQVAPIQQDDERAPQSVFDGQSRTQEQEFDQQQEVAVPQQFVTNDNPQYISNNYGFPANLQHQLNYGVIPTNNVQNQPGVAALAFSRFLQDSRDSVEATTFEDAQKADDIVNDEDDSVVVEADENENKKDIKNEKIELSHKDLKSDPVVAEVHPRAVAVAGVGGIARSSPSGTAVAGPEGLAVASPVATALAGVPEKKVKAPAKA